MDRAGQAKRERCEPLAVRRVYAKLTFAMKSTTRARFALALAMIAATGAQMIHTGCVVVAAGAGAGAAVAYVRGDLDSTLNANLDRSLRAVNKAIDQLQFAKVSEHKDALEAVVIARNASDKKIEIHLNKLTDDAMKLKIRVGTFGDNAVSLAILDKIRANL